MRHGAYGVPGVVSRVSFHGHDEESIKKRRQGILWWWSILVIHSTVIYALSVYPLSYTTDVTNRQSEKKDAKPIGPSQTQWERVHLKGDGRKKNKTPSIRRRLVRRDPALMPHIKSIIQKRLQLHCLARSFSLPIGQHVLDGAVVLWDHIFLDLLLGQPPEVLETQRVDAQVGLSGHDAALHEEGLLAQQLDLGLLVDLGFPEIVDEVANGVVSDHPGVHVDTGGLGEGSLCGLDVKKAGQCTVP